jgi:hypothetical protein
LAGNPRKLLPVKLSPFELAQKSPFELPPTFAQKVFAISAAAPDNPRWRRNAHAAATWPNRFLTTKF